jgi:intracellular septation protein
MHAVFEYIPLVIFYVVWKFADLYWATGSLIVTSALQILYYVIQRKPIPMKNWVIFGLIAVFGGLTIVMHDDTFLKWKVTIINEFFAIALLVSHYIFKKNIIKQFLGESLTLPEKIWSKLNLSWALFFALCGLLNLYIAFNFDQVVWVNFKVFGLTGLTFVFAIASVFSLYKYMPKDEVENTNDADNPINSNK